MPKTIRDQAEQILAANGWIRDPQPQSLKRRVWIKRGRIGKYYLGSAGSIRTGRNLAESLPVPLKSLAAMTAN